MTIVHRLFHWLRGKPPQASDPVAAALARFSDPQAPTLPLLRELVAALRPRRRGDAGGARLTGLLERLEADPALCAAFRHHVVHFLASRRLLTFFTESGILPGTGFFSEWWRILGQRLLPEVPDEGRLKDCLHVIFERGDDWRWLENLPEAVAPRFWRLLAPGDTLADADWRRIQEQMLDALLLLAHRVSGLGLDGELMRASPNFEADTPRFIALSAAALDYVQDLRAALDGSARCAEHGSHLRVIVSQCQDSLQRVRKRARSVGTSLHLSYTLIRAEQCLQRLEELLAILDAEPANAQAAWSDFARSAFLAESRRHSLRDYLGQLSRLLAVRVTENAARSGEHYICTGEADYRRMWRSAAGAGVLIGGMALLKIQAAALQAPLFVEALLFSLIYGVGFVIIYLLGLTVATKQPAMTAQTLAGLLGDLKPTRAADLERLVDVIAAVCRSQLAAIAGNVLLALPVAIGLSVGLSHWLGAPLIAPAKAEHLLADLDLLGWALPHAAIAGFYLYLSGLLTGYFDNQAAYSDLGARLARRRGLRTLLGRHRAQRLGDYLQEHLGGIMGNLLFGCMLGSTGVIGTILGLPLDIRHIAFSSANLGYGLSGHGFALAWPAVLWAATGVGLIGLTNLVVSFALALRTALGARRIPLTRWGPLLGALGRRLRREPRSFLLPPPGEGPNAA